MHPVSDVLLGLQDSHSSIEASAAGMDESSDHSVEDERQNLRQENRKEAACKRLF